MYSSISRCPKCKGPVFKFINNSDDKYHIQCGYTTTSITDVVYDGTGYKFAEVPNKKLPCGYNRTFTLLELNNEFETHIEDSCIEKYEEYKEFNDSSRYKPAKFDESNVSDYEEEDEEDEYDDIEDECDEEENDDDDDEDDIGISDDEDDDADGSVILPLTIGKIKGNSKNVKKSVNCLV